MIAFYFLNTNNMPVQINGVEYVDPFDPSIKCQICGGPIIRTKAEVNNNHHMGKICWPCERDNFRGKNLSEEGIKKAAEEYKKKQSAK